MVAEHYVVIDTRAEATNLSVVGNKPFYGITDLVDEVVILPAGTKVPA
jgi:hypothetical protein